MTLSAEDMAIDTWKLTLTHHPESAAAVVVGLLRPPHPEIHLVVEADTFVRITTQMAGLVQSAGHGTSVVFVSAIAPEGGAPIAGQATVPPANTNMPTDEQDNG